MPHATISEQQRNRAKRLRAHMTRAETLLWRYLKAGRVAGFSFRRQVPMGQFIADFACHQARLIVEIDGESHDFEERQGRDRRRDEWFEEQGYAVLRFTNEQVMSTLEGVVSVIREAAENRLPGSPPLVGEGQGGGFEKQTNTSSTQRAGELK